MKLNQAMDRLETKLRILEETFDSEREKLATVLSTVYEGIIMLDQNRQVSVINQTAAKIFRVTNQTAIGQPFINLARDHEMDGIVQKCLETNQKQSGIIQVTASRKYLELTAKPINEGTLILVRDLTDIRRLEKIRRDFIANISHELRTPIASCKAIVETLQNGAINDKKITEDFLQRMQIETDKLAQMVNELGELSRIESGELKLNLEPMNMAGVIDRVITRLQAQADRANVVINLENTAELPLVTGDAQKIEQVLVNLLHNAIKFTPPQGNITIACEVHDSTVSVSVRDTGIGIPENDLPHIFERFYKVDKARSSGGTGLGLAIAKHIIQAHGGEIWVESEEGKGSNFDFSLSLATR